MAVAHTPRTLLAEYLRKSDGEITWTELPAYYPDPLSTKRLVHVELQVDLNNDETYKERGIGVITKLAKLEAAKNMLIKLAKDKPDLKSLLEQNNFDTMVERSFKDAEKNVLQQLNDLCLVNKLSVKFTLIDETGTPENKLYTIRCEVDTLKPVQGTRKTMKAAKNACAKKVIEMIEAKKKLTKKVPRDFKTMLETPANLKEDILETKRILASRTIHPVARKNVKLSKLHLLETDPDCFVIRVLNDVKQKKGMDHDTFCRFLNFASLDELKLIIERLVNEASITCSVAYEDLPPSSQRPVHMFIAFVRYFYRDFSKSFASIGTNKAECERKAYVNMLTYLSDLRLNTTGRSAMLDNASSDED